MRELINLTLKSVLVVGAIAVLVGAAYMTALGDMQMAVVGLIVGVAALGLTSKKFDL